MRDDGFFERLHAVLAGVPEERSTPPEGARVGAVLVLLVDTDTGPTFVLTRRRRDLRSHPGQVSFPGGRMEDGESAVDAALREAREEIGLQPDSVEVVGVGPTFFIPPSKFWVVPVAARWVAPHEVDPSPWEVDEVLHVPLAQLLERDRWRQVPLSAGGVTWAWQLDDDLLWGATAMVVALLLDAVVPDWSGGASPSDLDDDREVRPWEFAPPVARRVRLEGEVPEVAQADVPHVTLAQMREVDRLLFDEVGLDLPQLVEQAGRGLAHATRRLLGGDTDGTRVTVLAGKGGNGAGGLTAARLLAAAGADVTAVLTGEPTLGFHHRVLAAAGAVVLRLSDDGSLRLAVDDDADAVGERVRASPSAPAATLAELPPGDVVLDAMLGIGAEPPLRGPVGAAVGWLRRHDVPVVSLDLPSGIHADRGLQGDCVTADVTVTIAAPKVGLRPPVCQPYVGDLYVLDLGVPATLWARAGVDPVTIFTRGPLVRLSDDDVASDAGTPEQAVVPDA